MRQSQVQVVTEASMKLESKDKLSTVLQEWYAKGASLDIPGASTRIWRQGTGPTVVCLHGVPTSA